MEKRTIVKHLEAEKLDIGRGFIKQDFPQGEQLNVLHWDIADGSVLPTHSHPEEQFEFMIKGAFRLTVGDEEFLVEEGDGYIVSSGVPHSCVAVGDVETLDIFSPAKVFPWMKKDCEIK